MITAGEETISTLGAEAEIELLRERLDQWLEHTDPELREALSWALAGTRSISAR